MTEFSGTFDGNDFTISNLYINIRSNKVGAGLFGWISGRLEDIGLLNIYVKRIGEGTGENIRIGGLVGLNFGTINNCYATGSVTGTGSGVFTSAGGLVGLNNNTISNCYATVSVTEGYRRYGHFQVAGGLVGVNYEIIRNSYATGTVIVTGGIDINIGGLVGLNFTDGTITNSYATGNVTATNTDVGSPVVGGLVGKNYNIVNSCYATGRVVGTTELGNPLLGGLVGDNLTRYRYTGTITNSLWDITSTGQTTSSGSPNEAGLSTAELQALTVNNPGLSANDFDFGTNSQYPALCSYVEENGQQVEGTLLCDQPNPRRQCNEAPITPPVTTLVDANNNGLLDIYYIEDLDAVRNDSAANYELLRSLDFTDPNSYRSAVVNADFIPNVEDPSQATNPGFSPIYAFAGTFEGNSFTISNLYINIVSTNRINAGLFSFVLSTGRVQDIGLLNVYIKATGVGSDLVYAGGLVGTSFSGSTISNSYVAGEITGTGSSSVYAGGLLGWNLGTINSSYAAGEITGTGTGSGTVYAGGLVGVNQNTINNNYATGEVTGTGVGSGSVYAGGLVGFSLESAIIENCYATGEVTGTGSNIVYIGGLVGTSASSGIIRNCYATGEVTATSGYIAKAGGLMGLNFIGAIENCYATGAVTGTGTSNGSVYAGGLMGDNDDITRNCYATGNVTATNTGVRNPNVGGLVGENSRGGTITNSFWDITSTGQTTSTGSPNTAGLSTEQLQALTANNSGLSANDFDFGANSQYPALLTYVEENGQQVEGTLLCDQPNPRRQCNEGPITPPTQLCRRKWTANTRNAPMQPTQSTQTMQ